jgi:hypothetical protein
MPSEEDEDLTRMSRHVTPRHAQYPLRSDGKASVRLPPELRLGNVIPGRNYHIVRQQSRAKNNNTTDNTIRVVNRAIFQKKS